jgi:hypothetical protein
MPARSIEWLIAECSLHRRFKLCVDGVQFVRTEQLLEDQESEGLKVTDLLFRKHYVPPLSIPFAYSQG